MDKIDTFYFQNSKEGWGICNDGEYLYKSDGTDRIWRLDPNTLEELDYIQVYTNTGRVREINELEWIEGRVFSNVYTRNAISIRSEEHTSELQSRGHLVCRLLLEK